MPPAFAHQNNQNKSSSLLSGGWKSIVILMTVILVPWAFYIHFHPRFNAVQQITATDASTPVVTILKQQQQQQQQKPGVIIQPAKEAVIPVVKPLPANLPVLGPIPTNGAKPLYGATHKGTDAIFALACNYPKIYYQRFVG